METKQTSLARMSLLDIMIVQLPLRPTTCHEPTAEIPRHTRQDSPQVFELWETPKIRLFSILIFVVWWMYILSLK